MRPSLDETPKGPFVKGLLVALGLLAALAALLLIRSAGEREPAFPKETPLPAQRSETPLKSPAADSGVPAVAVNPARTLQLTGALSGLPVLDPSVFGGKLLFVTGADPLLPDTLVQYDLSSGEASVIETPQRTRQSVRNPVGNERYLAYLDADGQGGGSIRVRDFGTGADAWLCDFAFGAPRLLIDGGVLFYTARTDERTVKLFAVDLAGGESAVANIWTDAAHASSQTSLSGGRLVFSQPAGDAQSDIVSSEIVLLEIATGGRTVRSPEMYAHDPAAAGEGFAFLSGPHGPKTTLYLMKQDGIVSVAENAVDFGVTGSCIVYQSGDAIAAYVLSTGQIYPLAEANAALLAAENGFAVWRDGTDPEQTQIRYMETE